MQRWLLPYADVVTLLFAIFAYQYFVGVATPPRFPLSPVVTHAVPARVDLAPTSSPTPVVVPDGSIQLAEQLQGALRGVDAKLFQIYRDERGVVLVMSDSPLLFASASPDMAAGGRNLLQRVVPVLLHAESRLRIEGHADNQPLLHPIYRDNWELSLWRAASVSRYLMEQGVPPEQLTMMGFGDRHPVAANQSEEGRRRNRRVELIFQFQRPEVP